MWPVARNIKTLRSQYHNLRLKRLTFMIYFRLTHLKCGQSETNSSIGDTYCRHFSIMQLAGAFENA